MTAEQSLRAPIPPQPAAELEAVFAGLQSPDLRPPLGVEEFLDKETFVDKAKRIGQTMMYGSNVSVYRRGKRIDTVKPALYNTDGYVDNVANAIDGLIAETGEFPDSLYDVAETAAAAVNQERRDHRYFRDDPKGVEAAGLLRAITTRPDFIKNSRAEEVLAQLGQASGYVCREDMFVDKSGRQPKIKDGYDVESVQDFQRIATSDVLWGKGRGAVWPLTAAATALETLAINHPGFTQDARLAVLRENEAHGSRMPEVDFHLVYSFNTDDERAFLERAAAQDMHHATGSRVAQDILSGHYEGIRWAI